MKIIKKTIFLALCIIMMNLSYTRQQAAHVEPSENNTTATSQAPKPMATALPMTDCTVTNATKFNIKIVFYDNKFFALTSQTNISGQSNIYIPVGAAFFDIYSGATKVIASSPIKPKISYTILQNGANWTVLPSA